MVSLSIGSRFTSTHPKGIQNRFSGFRMNRALISQIQEALDKRGQKSADGKLTTLIYEATRDPADNPMKINVKRHEPGRGLELIFYRPEPTPENKTFIMGYPPIISHIKLNGDGTFKSGYDYVGKRVMDEELSDKALALIFYHPQITVSEQ